jgi:hypothetical protein
MIMRMIARFPRWGLLLAVVLLVGGLILAAHTGESTTRHLVARIARENQRQKDLDQRLDGTFARIRRKERLVRNLLDGQMSLLQAAAGFHALDRLPPAVNQNVFRLVHPGTSDEERQCRAVIAWVRHRLDKEDPCLSLAMGRRLEDELQARLRHGPLRLPETPQQPVFLAVHGAPPDSSR